MSVRDTILDALRRNRPAGEYPLPDLPDFPLDDGGDRIAFFENNLKGFGGKVHRGPPEEAIAALFPDAQVVASVVPEIAGNRDVTAGEQPGAFSDVDVTVVRAAFGIAETGTVALPDDVLTVNALAYLAQHLLVLLDPADIVPGIQDAYRRPEFAQHHYVAFHTGPSATADIEGVLIHGAQGVRSLTVILASRA